MKGLTGGMFNAADRLNIVSLSLRDKRGKVLTSNIANSETPGFRALGYGFEEQLQDLVSAGEPTGVKTNDPRHLKNGFTEAGGVLHPDVFIRPTETVGEDGNTVDVDNEMMRLSENQILFRTAVETINRKVGMLRYAINGGR